MKLNNQDIREGKHNNTAVFICQYALNSKCPIHKAKVILPQRVLIQPNRINNVICTTSQSHFAIHTDNGKKGTKVKIIKLHSKNTESDNDSITIETFDNMHECVVSFIKQLQEAEKQLNDFKDTVINKINDDIMYIKSLRQNQTFND